MSEVENNEVPAANEVKDYIEDGKNKMIVKCKFCGSKILDKNSAAFITLQVKFRFLSVLFVIVRNCQVCT